MLNKLYEVLYNKIFINIVIERSQSIVYVEVCNKTDVLRSESKSFSTTAINTKMDEFIDSFVSESPYFYISILDNSSSQGAIPTCQKQNISKYYDINSSEYKCYKKRWIYYTEKNDIYRLEAIYEKIGLDFIFSPFVILANFFKDKMDGSLALYALIEDNFLTLAVFENSELLYGDHINMEYSDESDELLMDDDEEEDIGFDLEEEGIDLEDIDAMDDIEALEDFADIEDLDSISEIDDFAESEEKEEEVIQEINETPLEDVGFSEDYQRFSFMQSSINHFYTELRYESKFIENIYIADSIGISGDLKKYLEEEMFLNVFVRQLDLSAEVCEIAKAEIL